MDLLWIWAAFLAYVYCKRGITTQYVRDMGLPFTDWCHYDPDYLHH